MTWRWKYKEEIYTILLNTITDSFYFLIIEFKANNRSVNQNDKFAISIDESYFH